MKVLKSQQSNFAVRGGYLSVGSSQTVNNELLRSDYLDEQLSGTQSCCSWGIFRTNASKSLRLSTRKNSIQRGNMNQHEDDDIEIVMNSSSSNVIQLYLTAYLGMANIFEIKSGSS